MRPSVSARAPAALPPHWTATPPAEYPVGNPPSYPQGLPAGPAPGSPGRYAPSPVWFKPMPGKGGFGKRGLLEVPPPFEVPSPGRIAWNIGRSVVFRANPYLGLALTLLEQWYNPFDVQPMKPLVPFWDPGGYVQTGTCVNNGLPSCGSSPREFWVDVGTNMNNCLVGQAQFSPNFPPPGFPTWLHWFRKYDVSPPASREGVCGLGRSQSLVKFNRVVATGPLPSPTPLQWTPSPIIPFPIDPPIDPVSPFGWSPFTMPPFGPPIPYKLIPLVKARAPHMVSISGGNGPPAGGRPGMGSPRGPSDVPTTSGPPHVVRPPQKGEKEHKPERLGNKGVRALTKVANGITEMNDAVKAIYSALPGRIRAEAKCKTMQCKLRVLYRHGDKISWPKAVNALIQNEIQDRAIGKWGKLSKKAVRNNPYWNSPVGLQAGGRYRPQPPAWWFN